MSKDKHLQEEIKNLTKISYKRHLEAFLIEINKGIILLISLSILYSDN